MYKSEVYCILISPVSGVKTDRQVHTIPPDQLRTDLDTMQAPITSATLACYYMYFWCILVCKNPLIDTIIKHN